MLDGRIALAQLDRGQPQRPLGGRARFEIVRRRRQRLTRQPAGRTRVRTRQADRFVGMLRARSPSPRKPPAKSPLPATPRSGRVFV